MLIRAVNQISLAATCTVNHVTLASIKHCFRIAPIDWVTISDTSLASARAEAIKVHYLGRDATTVAAGNVAVRDSTMVGPVLPT